MKLQHLTESGFDKSQISNKFDSEIIESIDSFVTSITKAGLKFVKMEDDGLTTITLSSSLLQVELEVGKTNPDNYLCEIRITITPTYLAVGQSYFKDSVNMYLPGGMTKDKAVKYLKDTNEIIQTLNDINEWYMDVSGEYGKVKIYSDWRNERKVVAIAGDYTLSDRKSRVY